MKRDRDLIIKVIKHNKITNRKLAEYFAQKFSEKYKNTQKEKS